MALEDQNIPIIGKGVDTNVDPNAAPIGTIELVENMIQVKPGRYEKRPGAEDVDLVTTNPALFPCKDGLYVIGQHVDVRSSSGDDQRSHADFLGSGQTDIGCRSELTSDYFSQIYTSLTNVIGDKITDVTSFDCAYSLGYGGSIFVAVTYAKTTTSTFNCMRLFLFSAQDMSLLAASSESSGDQVRAKAIQRNNNTALYGAYTFYASNTARTLDVIACAFDPGTSIAKATNTATSFNVGTFAAAGNLIYDVMPITHTQAGRYCLVAYRAAAGGVQVMIFDMIAHSAVTSVNIAAADANLGIALLQDVYSSGVYHLVTCGTTSGLIRRTLNTTTLAVTATNTLDASATANVQNVTGYVTSAGGNVDVFYDVTSATANHLDLVKRVRWTGSASVITYTRSVSIAGKVIYAPTLVSTPYKFYLPVAYSQAPQWTCFLLNLADIGNPLAGSPFADRWLPYAKIAPFRHGGRTAVAGHLPTPTLGGGSATAGYDVYMGVQVASNIVVNNGTYTVTRGGAVSKLKLEAQPVSADVAFDDLLVVPGGTMRYGDTTRYRDYLPHIAPEAPGASQTTGGSLTTGATYQFIVVPEVRDASGRRWQGLPSLPTSITLTGSNNRVDLTVYTCRIGAGSQFGLRLVIYRTEGDGTVFYRETDVYNDGANADTYAPTLSVTQADTAITDNELLYAQPSGGVLENESAPPCSAVTVHNNRVWVVNSEDPTQIQYSKELFGGVGIAFNEALYVSCNDKRGAVTALASMDDRLIIFKARGIYAVNGDPADDTGANASLSLPQFISDDAGTASPIGVVHTPIGIIFRTPTKGFYLLTRGMDVQYIGAPVADYNSLTVTGAGHVADKNQVRFATSAGTTLIYDYLLAQWYTFTGQTAVSAATAAGTWCWAGAEGSAYHVYRESASLWQDDGVSYTARIRTAWISAAGIQGFQRIREIQLLGDEIGAHTVTVKLYYDYNDTVAETLTASATSDPWRWSVCPSRQKCSAIKIEISETSNGAGFRLSAISIRAGVKRGQDKNMSGLA